MYNTDGLATGIRILQEEHPELEELHLRLEELEDGPDLKDILEAYNPILKSLSLRGCDFDPEVHPINIGKVSYLKT